MISQFCAGENIPANVKFQAKLIELVLKLTEKITSVKACFCWQSSIFLA
jgi:hypothetical protein